jgi:hypothetical protein
MRVQLFGIGMKGPSPMIGAQRRINCFLAPQAEPDRTSLALIGSPGLTLFNNALSGASRGMWAVNTLSTPLIFTVHLGTLYSINNAGVTASIGTIGTTTGDVSMADNGTTLVLVDGSKGYTYNMVTPAGLNQITDGNFTTSPKTVTWQDTYFIVTAGSTNQFQLSNGSDATTWPAVNINFTGSSPGALQAGIADHSVLNLMGDVYAEFWQDTGSPDFPYASIPGSAQEFGLASPWSLSKYDNSLAGLFKNKMGEANISRMEGFRLQKLSSVDLDYTINGYSNVADAEGFGYMLQGHPMYQIGFPTAGKTWEYDGYSKAWGERQSTTGGRYWANKFAFFVNRRLVSDYRNGNIYQIDPTVYSDNGSEIGMEVHSRHIWNDDKYLTIPQIQVDVQAGVGLATGQGSNPQLMLEISKDGGQSFSPWAWQSMGKIGQTTQRVIWNRLGRARDWVLKLRITDPVYRVLVGASAEIVGGSF